MKGVEIDAWVVVERQILPEKDLPGQDRSVRDLRHVVMPRKRLSFFSIAGVASYVAIKS